MNRKLQLIIILCLAIGIAALGSHFVMFWFGMRDTSAEQRIYGNTKVKNLAFAAGSSLMEDGILFEEISRVFGIGIESWFVPGSSPPEWEVFQRQADEDRLTFIVISAYDLNEHFLCDFRANVVPLNQSVKDLYQSRSDWRYSKRLLSQYPMKYIRFLFPTAGRSGGVMGKLRERLSKLFLLSAALEIEAEAGPVVPSGKVFVSLVNTERISNWSQGKMIRRIAGMRGASGNRHTFDGIKQLAFQRMLQYGQRRGRVVVVVLPVSPVYVKEFLTPEVAYQFENALAVSQRNVPQAEWIRLDQLPELKSNEYFSDLVHMNTYSKKIATEELLLQLDRLGILP